MRKTPSLSFRSALALALLATWSSDNTPLGVSALKSQDKSEDVFFNFVTRPDIAAPKWDVNIYDEDALSPGYWFVAPYKDLKQESYSAWNGPHIYDGHGELIWSGSPMFEHYNTYDFRASDYDGKHMISLITHKDEAGFLIDSTYQIQKTVNMTSNVPDWALDKMRNERTANMHEFYVIANGTRVLMLTKVFEHTSVEESKTVGFDGNCTAKWEGFKEVDLATGEVLFEWNGHGHIRLDEGTIQPGLCDRTLPSGYDSPHTNAIDKFDDGDYLLSGRHTDTIYKISHHDGSIVWRLGGKTSDFHFQSEDATFRRQHYAKFMSQNDSHTVISMFDNSVGNAPNDDFEHARSRGLILALRTDTTPMTAEVVQTYELSERRRIRAKGDMQILPNNNAFICWSKRSELSEHSSDGKVLMDAAFKPDHVDTYRGYKFPWVGLPATPPDLKSFTDLSGKVSNTTVYVSWNGATEVRTWNVYGTNSSDDDVRLVTSAKRQGFETMLTFDGYAGSIYAEALDVGGNVLGRSGTFKTIVPAPEVSHDRSIFVSPIIPIIAALLSCTIALLVVLVAVSSPERRRLWWPSKVVRYAAVAGDDMTDEGKGIATSDQNDDMLVYPPVK